jgi:hypothetical protein
MFHTDTLLQQQVSNHGKNSVSNTGEQTRMVVTKGDGEALGNRVQLRTVVV